MTLRELNTLGAADAAPFFRQCCNAGRWVEAMVTGRPYPDLRALSSAAGRAFRTLGNKDWMEAFAGHPKIGDVKDLRKKYPDTAEMSEAEQSGIGRVTDQLLTDLAAANERYEKKFGYIFIVCATGKRADEMLAILNGRMSNRPDEELKVAAQEQEKITQLRLEKIIS